MWIGDDDFCAERPQALGDRKAGGFADVPGVPLVGQSEQEYPGTVHGATVPVQGPRESGHDVIGHAGIDVVGKLDESKRLAEAPPHLPREIAGIDGETMPPYSW